MGNDKKQQSIDLFRKNKCCVIIPVYNNSGTIEGVIQDVLLYCSDVYVVNDGSTDNTLEKINRFRDRINIITYEQNRGKGNALVKGFKKAFADGFEYAVTIDADGQHYAYDLPVFVEKLEEEKNVVIIGARRVNESERSGGSNFANKFSNFWFKVETGVSLDDTQSGYRLYPLKPVAGMKFYSSKYEFEIEVIVRLSWKGYKIINVPVDVYYPSREERVSHFRPFWDFVRISILNTVLVTLAFLFFRPRNVVRKNKNRKIKDIIKNDILNVNAPVHVIALSIGFGVFMGIVPIWGYQLAVGFPLAHLFRLNKSIFFVAANISLPPMIPFILYFSYLTGGYVLGDGGAQVSLDDISLETLNLKQYLAGAVILAVVSGIAAGLISYFVLSLIRKIKNN
jgi:glycosyltransferase involved in cell wall biosynthesis